MIFFILTFKLLNIWMIFSFPANFIKIINQTAQLFKKQISIAPSRQCLFNGSKRTLINEYISLQGNSKSRRVDCLCMYTLNSGPVTCTQLQRAPECFIWSSLAKNCDTQMWVGARVLWLSGILLVSWLIVGTLIMPTLGEMGVQIARTWSNLSCFLPALPLLPPPHTLASAQTAGLSYSFAR